jgi:hypothetical protein
MHPYMIELARQRDADLRKSARRYGPMCPAHTRAAAARSGTAPGGRWSRSASRSPTDQAMPDTQPAGRGGRPGGARRDRGHDPGVPRTWLAATGSGPAGPRQALEEQ